MASTYASLIDSKLRQSTHFAYLPAGQLTSSMLRLTPKKVITRSRFSLSEDATLRGLVHSMGGKAWEEIASAMPGRSARQCRDRFQNYLADDINRRPWTPCEDALLSRQYQRIGGK
jgi:hypothetical protein